MNRDENELLRTLLDSLPFDAWLKDINGNYIIANENLEKNVGLPMSEIIGSNDYALYPKTEADKYVASDGATIAGKVEGYFEVEHQKGKYLREYKKPIYSETAEMIGTVGFSVDITEKKRVEADLIESERSKAAFLSNLPGAAYRLATDADFTLTYISEGCFDLTGYTAEELLSGQPVYDDLFAPEYRKNLLKNSRKYFESKEIAPEEFKMVTASGEVKWVWNRSQKAYDSEGNCIAIEGFIVDVTKRKNIENALRESEESFRTIFEAAPAGFSITDSSTGKVCQFNKRFAEIVGRSEEEILNLSWQEYSHPDEIEENLRNLELLNNKKINGFSMKKRFIKADGSIVWVEMGIALLNPEDYPYRQHLCMLRDITPEKQSEEKTLHFNNHDSLTGLYNRRFCDEELKRIDTAKNLPLTITMADVNGLKLTNDAFGHSAGDQLLIKVADIIKKECRTGDIVARIGGDEFLIIFPKTNNLEAEKIVQRINSAISKEKMNNMICSVSFGWKTKTKSAEKIAKVYMQAEDIMYDNKMVESKKVKDETIRNIMQGLYKKIKSNKYHYERVSELCGLIGNKLEMSSGEIAELKQAGLFHDIGKIAISEKILNKKSRLSEIEWVEIKRHPKIGYYILKSSEKFANIAEYVLCHHERIDGEGYPRKLTGVEIPIQAKIISIADSYDAMTNKRPYKKMLTKAEAIEEIRKNEGTQFDTEIAELFIEMILKEDII